MKPKKKPTKSASKKPAPSKAKKPIKTKVAKKKAVKVIAKKKSLISRKAVKTVVKKKVEKKNTVLSKKAVAKKTVLKQKMSVPKSKPVSKKNSARKHQRTRTVQKPLFSTSLEQAETELQEPFETLEINITELPTSEEIDKENETDGYLKSNDENSVEGL